MSAESTAPVRFLSLFEAPVTGMISFLRQAIEPHLLDGYGHIVAAQSEQDADLLVGGSPKFVQRKESIWVPARTSLHSVSLSGQRDSDHGHAILENIFAEPARFGESVEHLYLRLIPRQENDRAPTADLYELIEQPTARWEDLIVPDVVKGRLQRNMSVLRHRKRLLAWGFGDIPGYGNRMVVALNLVGPSGTGKSFAAQVVAHELDRSLMIVDYAQLESKYVGDTSKNIRSVFSDARNLGDCVLFFDEADSFLGRRSEDVRHSYDTAVNSTRAVMLMELQSFQGIVLFATNLIKNYDPAFRRRILDHIEFPLPDAQARTRILDAHTPKHIPGRAGLDFATLGELSDSLSGGELANVAYQASLDLLARLDSRADLPEAELTVSDNDFIAAIRSAQRAREMLPDRIPQAPSFSQVIISDKPKGSESVNNGDDRLDAYFSSETQAWLPNHLASIHRLILRGWFLVGGGFEGVFSCR